MDILVTASGKSSRFGGEDKYLIDVLGSPMLRWALKSISPLRGNHVYIALSSDENKAKVEAICDDLNVSVDVLVVGETTGQAHTVKLALEQTEINDFLVMPVDTILTKPLTVRPMKGNTILTFTSEDYKSFSFVKVKGRKVLSIREKEEGDLATAGYYSFASKELYLKAWDMIDHSKEEYISAIYQALIDSGEPVRSHQIPAATVVDLGTPKKLKENLGSIFDLITAPLKKFGNADLATIRATFRKESTFHPHNAIVSRYLEDYSERPLSEDFGYGMLVHNYNRSAKAVNQLILEDDLSWLTLFLYDSVDSPYSLWRYLEDTKGATVVLIEDSPDIKYKVPHKRQFILDYFKAAGKHWTMLFDDDFSWRIAYKSKKFYTPASMKINFVTALKLLTWIAIEEGHDYVCTGTNVRRMQYRTTVPVAIKRGAIYWNIFVFNLDALERNGIKFVTDRPIHEDLAISLDIAKAGASAYVFFLIQTATYDFNQTVLVSREAETEAYGGNLWKIKTKIQGGIETKFFSVNQKEIENLERKSLFDDSQLSTI